MLREQPEKVLIVLHGAIGDVVRGLPLAVRLRRAWPKTRIIWAVEPKSLDILVDHPAIDEIIVFDRPKGLTAYVEFINTLKTAKPDLVLDLQRHLKSGVTGFLSGAKTRIGFNWKNSKEGNFLFNNAKIPFYPDSLSKIDHYQRFGDLLGLPKLEPLDFGLQFKAETREVAVATLSNACQINGISLPAKDRRVALLIGGSWKSKRWTARSFAAVAQMIICECQSLPVIFGGPGDESLAEEILTLVNDRRCVSVVSRTNLRQLAFLLSQVNSAVSTDSGPMHLAAAVGTPVISVWGPTDPERAGPYNNEQLVVRSTIGCAPCYLRACPGLDGLCLSGIPLQNVFQKLKSIHGC